jgi:hypothetical protein
LVVGVACAEGPEGGFGSVADVEFLVDVAEVEFDCLFCDPESAGELGVGGALCDECEDFLFAAG